MSLRWAFGMLAVSSGISAGCSSLSVPVLRHETAEPLGSGRFRVRGNIESARLLPLLGVDAAAFGIPQDDSIFRGWSFGVQGAAGLTSKMDAQIGTTYMLGGSGWRIGLKHYVWSYKKVKFAAMAGYGRYSAKGTTQFKTAGTPLEVSLTQSAYQVDISTPVSMRLSTTTALYAGLNFYKSGMSGSAENAVISSGNNDLGINLGLKLNFGKFEGDVEFALIRINDPFADGNRFVPFWGISGGIVF